MNAGSATFSSAPDDCEERYIAGLLQAGLKE